MPIIKSAQKRVRIESRRRKRNLVTKDQYKGLIKEFLLLVEAGKTAEAAQLFPQVQRAIDMAAKKNQLHKNTAGRKKAGLAKMIAKEAAPKKEAKAATSKKPAAKKATKKDA